MDDMHISIAKIYQIDNKGGNMTLNEKRKLDEYYAYLPKTYGTYDDTSKIMKPYTTAQALFVQQVLPTFIKCRIPKLDQVLAVYGFDMNTIFVWRQSI